MVVIVVVAVATAAAAVVVAVVVGVLVSLSLGARRKLPEPVVFCPRAACMRLPRTPLCVCNFLVVVVCMDVRRQ